MIEEIALAGTHCFEADAVLGDLATINYVFGPNGSGKTTISQGLASLSVTDDDARGLGIRWGRTKPTVKVYNRDYVRKAFTSVNGEEPGVFLLGKDDGEAYEKIKGIEKQKTKADQKATSAQANLDQRLAEAKKLRSDLADTIWRKRSVIPTMIQQRMPGLRGSKDQCLEKVLATAKAYPLRGNDDFGALAEKAAVAFDESAKEQPLYAAAPELTWDESALQAALETRIVGSADIPLMELIERLGNSDWVHEGLDHLKSGENIEGLCPFCQQKPPEELAGQLAIVFDETYEKKQAEVAGFLAVITQAIATLELYTKANAASLAGAVGEEEVDGAFHALSLGLAAVETAVNQKLLKPSDKVGFVSVKADYDSLIVIVNRANDAVRKTNAVIAGRHVQRNLIVDEAWREFTRGHLNDLLDSHVNQSTRLDRVVQSLQDTIHAQRQYAADYEAQLRTLRSKTMSSAATIDDINRLLELSQFHSFKLAAAKAKKDGYRIIREDGQPVDIETLSEGERTFITFLYFFHSLSEVKQEHEADSVLAVIDDPISSLDGDIMFVVSALIRMLIEETRGGNHGRVQQVIMLTHNTRFHNEVSYQHKEGTSATKYYRIRKYAPEPNVVEDCGPKNPIRTAYQELWDEVQTASVYRTKQMPWLPNVMRRILESYFTTLGGEKNLYEVGAELLPVERALHNALIAWSHSGSHTIMDGEVYAQNSAPSGRWLEAFKRIFEKASNGAHFGHYAMMMERAHAYVV